MPQQTDQERLLSIIDRYASLEVKPDNAGRIRLRDHAVGHYRRLYDEIVETRLPRLLTLFDEQGRCVQLTVSRGCVYSAYLSEPKSKETREVSGAEDIARLLVEFIPAYGEIQLAFERWEEDTQRLAGESSAGARALLSILTPLGPKTDAPTTSDPNPIDETSVLDADLKTSQLIEDLKHNDVFSGALCPERNWSTISISTYDDGLLVNFSKSPKGEITGVVTQKA